MKSEKEFPGSDKRGNGNSLAIRLEQLFGLFHLSASLPPARGHQRVCCGSVYHPFIREKKLAQNSSCAASHGGFRLRCFFDRLPPFFQGRSIFQWCLGRRSDPAAEGTAAMVHSAAGSLLPAAFLAGRAVFGEKFQGLFYCVPSI